MAKDTPTPQKRTAKPAYFEDPYHMIRPGLAALRVNVGTIVWLVVAPVLVSIPVFFLIVVCAHFMVSYTQGGIPWDTVVFSAMSVLLYVGLLVLSVYIAIGLIFATLRSADGEKFGFWNTFKLGRKFFWRTLGLFLSTALVVAAGLILFVVPGLIMLKRYFLAPFYMVDKDLGVFDAMRASADDTAETGGVWGILAALVILSLPSLIPGVGWALATALGVLYICVPALRYREIQQVLEARAKKSKNAETDKAVEEVLEKVAKTPKAVIPAKVAKPKRKKQTRRARLAEKAKN
jgi:hypothetical protein